MSVWSREILIHIGLSITLLLLGIGIFVGIYVALNRHQDDFNSSAKSNQADSDSLSTMIYLVALIFMCMGCSLIIAAILMLIHVALKVRGELESRGNQIATIIAQRVSTPPTLPKLRLDNHLGSVEVFERPPAYSSTVKF